jgi:hypothetical protein
MTPCDGHERPCLQRELLIPHVCNVQGIWTALGAYAWSPDLQVVIGALKDRQRQKAMQLLSRSYSTVSPRKAATLLGMPEADVLTCVFGFCPGARPYTAKGFDRNLDTCTET